MSQGADISSFLRGLDLADAKIVAAVELSATRFMEVTIGLAQKYCPVDSGDLEDSGHGENADLNGNVVTCRGGFGVDYAAIVHERLDMHFNTTRKPEAQAKFLERAVREMTPKLGKFLADDVAAQLHGGSK